VDLSNYSLFVYFNLSSSLWPYFGKQSWECGFNR